MRIFSRSYQAAGALGFTRTLIGGVGVNFLTYLS